MDSKIGFLQNNHNKAFFVWIPFAMSLVRHSFTYVKTLLFYFVSKIVSFYSDELRGGDPQSATYIYVFGYGSLIWRPGEYLDRYNSFRARGIGWKRMFAQVYSQLHKCYAKITWHDIYVVSEVRTIEDHHHFLGWC